MDIKGKKSPGEANNCSVNMHAFEATFFFKEVSVPYCHLIVTWKKPEDVIINLFTSLTYRVAMTEFSLLYWEAINFLNPIFQTKKLRRKAGQLYHVYLTCLYLPQDLLIALLRL